MNKKLSVEEIKAVAETAIVARQKALDAKAVAEAAGGADAALNAAVTAAEQASHDAEAEALALSQTQSEPEEDTEKKKKVDKLLRKKYFINEDLKALGIDSEEDDEEEDDLDKPLTRRDLQQIEAGKARHSAVQLADAITDPLDREAVKKALHLVVPTANSEKDFQAAVAIANIDRNSKLLEEVGRKGVSRSSPTGSGAPALKEETFIPTPYEQMFMRQMGLSKDDILKARDKAKQKSA